MIDMAVQYLEASPEIATLAPDAVRTKLRDAFALLPINRVLLGWHLPTPLVQVCREEAMRANARLYRWQPLLTGDGELMPRPEWQTKGLYDQPVPGFQGMAEFTFICPNRPAVQEAVLTHLYELIRHGEYEGVFLDRMRWPSPAADPGRWLACFCSDCQRAAQAVGLDLVATQRSIQQLLTTPMHLNSFVHLLLDSRSERVYDPALAPLQAFLDFRRQSITRFVQATADLIHGEGLAVGLDCFSPALTGMVGQDLGALDACAEWTKVMTYCHTLGPAGLPFELLALADWLIEQYQMPEAQALTWLAQATGLPLPSSRAVLQQNGLPASALPLEMARARRAGVTSLLAGVELVEIPGVATLTATQIEADHRALRQSPIDGLALSWDLWHMTTERLALIRSLWQSPPPESRQYPRDNSALGRGDRRNAPDYQS